MTCAHLGMFSSVKPRTDGCEEWIGQNWVRLRICRGHVVCCDRSIGKHAAKPFRAMGHPVMEAYSEPDGWGWCRVDEVMIDLGGDVTPHPPGWTW